TGAVTYTPARDFNGDDAFVYQVCDAAGACGSATVSVHVTPVNDAPVAVADVVTTAEDTPVSISVTANDFDVDGNLDPTTVTITSRPASGTASVLAGGVVLYTPAADFNGTDRFVYQVCDTAGACATASATIIVTPVNDPPMVNPDAVTTREDTPIAIS